MNPVPVHFVAEGPKGGPVVVLSGSLGSDLRMWEPQVGPLVDAGFRVVRYDHRGHGCSPVVAGPYSLADLGEDVRALLDRLGVRRAHFVGLSLGGMVGMWLGQNASERLGSLTLCCTSAELGPRSGWVERARAVRAEGTAAVAEAVVQRWFTPGWRATHPGRVRFYESMVAATPAEGYAACCEAIGAMDIVNDLPRISAPVLVISGEQDPATPTVHGARIARAVAQGRLQEVGPAAHLASAEQPATVGALIAQHVRDHAGVMTAADQGVPSQAR